MRLGSLQPLHSDWFAIPLPVEKQLPALPRTKHGTAVIQAGFPALGDGITHLSVLLEKTVKGKCKKSLQNFFFYLVNTQNLH